jgi:hypothetical protein
MHAAMCVLNAFAIVVVWLSFRHNVALSGLAAERLGMSREAAAVGAGGGGLLFAGAVTVILGPFLVMAAAALYPIWRRSRAAWMISIGGAGLLAAACGLLFIAQLVLRPFEGFDGDWDLMASDNVALQYDLVARQDPTQWHRWAPLSLPALGAVAILTLVLQVRYLRHPRIPAGPADQGAPDQPVSHAAQLVDHGLWSRGADVIEVE